jgi:hypothetical protein
VIARCVGDGCAEAERWCKVAEGVGGITRERFDCCRYPQRELSVPPSFRDTRKTVADKGSAWYLEVHDVTENRECR